MNTQAIKQSIKQAMLASLDDEITTALAAAGEAQATASHADNKPENQYDTLALEAAYLAHGQSERILALQKERMQLNRWSIPTFSEDDSIRAGALVGLCLLDDDASGQNHSSHSNQANKPQPHWIQIAPLGARRLEVDGRLIQVVHQTTPIAKALLGREVGDEIELSLRGQAELWEIDVLM